MYKTNDRRVHEGIACNRRQWRMKGGRGWRSGRKNRVSEQHEGFDRSPQEDVGSRIGSAHEAIPKDSQGRFINQDGTDFQGFYFDY